jgi:hypothetical protein
MLEIIISAVLSVMICSRLLRALRDFAEAGEPKCPWLAETLDKALFRPVDSFLEAQGYYPSQKYFEAIQRASNAVQERDEANAKANELLNRMSDAARRVIALKSELAQARRVGRADPLFASVGLHESAPAFLVAAARRAYRSRWHPDVHAAHLKKSAEESFKRFDDAFDRIQARLRSAQ